MSKIDNNKIKISGLEYLYDNGNLSNSDTLRNIPLKELFTFRDHPFLVVDDEKMAETVESIRKYGVLNPGIARPRKGGGYELISGHRRKRALEILGEKTMPVFVRNYTDDEAIIIMVDSNIQREKIRPSERAKAYCMRYEAMKRDKRRGQGRTVELLGRTNKENAKTVQRYIRLSYLSDEYLDLVDKDILGIAQAVEVSYMSKDIQEVLLSHIAEFGKKFTVNHIRLLRNNSDSISTVRDINELLSGSIRAPNIVIKHNEIKYLVPRTYETKEIHDLILNLLKKWNSERNVDMMSTKVDK